MRFNDQYLDKYIGYESRTDASSSRPCSFFLQSGTYSGIFKYLGAMQRIICRYYGNQNSL